MRILTYVRSSESSRLRLGVEVLGGIVDAQDVARDTGDDSPWTPNWFLAGGLELLPRLRSLIHGRSARPSSEIQTLGPCVPEPGKIICIGLNYRRHALEAGLPVPDTPVVFSKFSNTVASPTSVVSLPSVAVEYDYEVELAVVIGATATDVPEPDALRHVLGYATANDMSARDLQRRTSQWLLGKSLDGFLPLGPYLVTKDAVPDPGSLRLRTWCNGALRQDSSTGDLIFGVPFLVSYLSRYMTLSPGDIILTGTPEGVIAGETDPRWLRSGDVVRVEVDGLGSIETTFA